MELLELKNDIMKGTMSHFYVFTGTELGIQKIYINQMQKVLGLPIVRADAVSDIRGNWGSRSLIGSSDALYIVRDDEEFMKNEKLYADVLGEIGSSYLIVLYEKIDARLKFGKTFKDLIIRFDRLDHNVLKSYIRKEVKLRDEQIEELIQACDGSYDIAMLECDKIKHYAQARDLLDEEALDILFLSDSIYISQDSNVFEFTDAVMRGDVKAFRLADILQESGVSSINILGTLYGIIKTVLLIQACTDKDVCAVTGLDNHQVYYNKKYVDVYTVSHLVDSLKLVAKVCDDVKGGMVSDDHAVKYCIAQIL